MPRGQLMWVTPVRFDHQGRPIDPDYGVDEGGHPDQGLPGGRPPHVGNRPPGSYPGRPDQGPVRPGRPVDPDWGIDEPEHIWGGGRPDQGLPRPPHTWPKPPGGGLPVDPGWGVGGRPGFGDRPDHGLPIWPHVPGKPDNTLPPVEGEGPPPTDPPPGTIWPPLPPSVPEGKAIVLIAISGVGYRYAVITVPPPKPGQGLPPQRPGVPGAPDQGLPQPPTAQPKR
jgi:hypothetical protein